ncbi:MAG: ADP-ribosylglycohydrolase family protein, partial [Rhodospirillales bacterium]|nr:ADP-ribosylglycohydrolase family protein [Rhodospirillales bacterium]
DQIRPGYGFDETCQKTVPEAITSALESISFVDAIRNAVSLGGDSDTLAAIAGPIAEALHGVPGELIDTTRRRYLAEAPDIVDAIGEMYAGSGTA